jgi:hypothetical protein
MPITGFQFELGTLDDPVELALRVHDFLSAHREFGYSASEVAPAACLTEETALILLEELTFLGAVEAREVKDGLFFRYVRDLKPDELQV